MKPTYLYVKKRPTQENGWTFYLTYGKHGLSVKVKGLLLPKDILKIISTTVFDDYIVQNERTGYYTIVSKEEVNEYLTANGPLNYNFIWNNLNENI